MNFKHKKHGQNYTKAQKIIKLLKTNDKEKSLKTTRENDALHTEEQRQGC